MGQVIKLGAQGKKELAVAFKVTMAYVGQVLSGQKKGGKAPAIWEAAKKRNDSKLYNVDEIAKHETVRIRVCCTTSLKEEYFLEQLALNY